MFPNPYSGGFGGNGQVQRQTPMMQFLANHPGYGQQQNASSSVGPGGIPGSGPQSGPVGDPRLVGPNAPPRGPQMSTPYTTQPTTPQMSTPYSIPNQQPQQPTWAQFQQSFANLNPQQWNMPQPGSEAPMVNQYMPMNPGIGGGAFNPTQNAWGQKPMSPFSGVFGPQKAF